MKRKEIDRISIKLITRLRNCAKCVTPGCDIEYIHALRVEFKKLRAFIRLLHLERGAKNRPEQDAKKKWGIPRQLKKIYTKAGEVRDRQLHYNNINSYYLQKPGRPIAYLENLSREMTARQEDLRASIRFFSFNEFRSDLKDHLPRKLRNGTVKAYFHRQKIIYNRLLLEAHSDESIHAVRKCVKDILYNADLLKHNKAAKRILGKKEEFKRIDDAIGEYNNFRIGISLLGKNLPLLTAGPKSPPKT
jgi:CHAD domain-containing protein